MSTATSSVTAATLPETGFLRQSDLIGEKPVTPEQAAANAAAGRSPVKPRPGRTGWLPISAPTLWRRVKAGDFPAPVKLSERVVAWRAEDVREWIRRRS